MPRQLLTMGVPFAVVAMVGGAIGVRGRQTDERKRLPAAAEVIKSWEPKLDGVEDYQQFVASPKLSDTMAAATFRVVGPSFERLWNYYADLCGIPDRYAAKRLLNCGRIGAKGTYVISDRASSDTEGRRALTVFLLRTDQYTVTVTIQPDADGKAMLGSIAAATW
jgi:hypothetical protein